MILRHLTADEVAAELGRSTDWLYRNWRLWCATRGMPRPIHETGELAWSAVQFWAWLDKDLPPSLQATSAAFRIATAEFLTTRKDVSETAEEAEWRARLARRFAPNA